MSAVADKHDEFVKLGVQVLSVSVDSVFVHKMWDENELSKMVEGGIPFPMLSDGGGKVGAVYGVYDADAGVETFQVGDTSLYFAGPDGERLELIADPLGEMYGMTVL